MQDVIDGCIFSPSAPACDIRRSVGMGTPNYSTVSLHREAATVDGLSHEKAMLMRKRFEMLTNEDFKQFDADNSGQICRTEFTVMFRKTMFIRKNELTDKDLSLIWAAIDVDRSGTIVLSEFMDFVKGGSVEGGGNKSAQKVARHGATLVLQANALRKDGKLEDCIPLYREALQYIPDPRARFVTMCSLSNSLCARAQQVRDGHAPASRPSKAAARRLLPLLRVDGPP